MKLTIKVKPNNKKPGIEKIDDKTYLVRVREAAIEGKANDAVRRAIAELFRLPQSAVRIVRGDHSREKILEIPQPEDKKPVENGK